MTVLMDDSLPLSVICSQPLSVIASSYRFRMESKCKLVMRDNVLALLGARSGLPPGAVGVSKLIALGLPNGTAQRVLSQDGDVRMEVLGQLAKALDVEPWQLLIPNIDANALPVISGATKPWPFEMVSEDRYDALSAAERAFVQSKFDSAIEAIELKRREAGSSKQAA